MSAAQVTEAHIARARASGYTTDKGVQMAAQFVANNEAAKAERDQLRTELDAQCLLNAKGSEREAVLLRRVDRMAKEFLNLRADLDAIKAIRDEETARAERAEAELAKERARNAGLVPLLARWLKMADDCHHEQQEVGYSEYNVTAGLMCDTRAAIDAEMKEEAK